VPERTWRWRNLGKIGECPVCGGVLQGVTAPMVPDLWLRIRGGALWESSLAKPDRKREAGTDLQFACPACGKSFELVQGTRKPRRSPP
jgi:predicted RNA-binding Zn-ribbon protein involved in translation (DUF1610 family)